MQPNPKTLAGSEYPDTCYAYHAILTESAAEAAQVFQDIIAADALVSLDELQITSEHTYPTDIVAGDTGYVFLSLGKPTDIRQDQGYIFVFDPKQLVEFGAIVGMMDLDPAYRRLALDAGEKLWEDEYEHWDFEFHDPDRVRTTFTQLQAATRLSGHAALRWIDWVCGDGPEPADLITKALEFTNRYQLFGPPGNPYVAQSMTEILFPKKLPLGLLVGTVEDHQFSWR